MSPHRRRGLRALRMQHALRNLLAFDETNPEDVWPTSQGCLEHPADMAREAVAFDNQESN